VGGDLHCRKYRRSRKTFCQGAESGPMAVRSVSSESSNAQHYQPGVNCTERIIAKALFFQSALPVIRDDDICALGQLLNNFHTQRSAQVGSPGTLVVIDELAHQAYAVLVVARIPGFIAGVGRSIFMTSVPKSPRNIDDIGPAKKFEILTTPMPDNGMGLVPGLFWASVSCAVFLSV
jgi:hypothetical protein